MADSIPEDLSQVEVELKFAVPHDAVDALVKAMRHGAAQPVRTQRLQAIYCDTVDDRLAAHRVVVRLRKEGPQWVQTAKASGGDAFRRLEHNVAVALPRGRRSPLLDLSRHDGTEVGAAIRAALGATALADAVLFERFRIDVSRLLRTERTDTGVLELAFDRGEITAGERSTPVCEFEMELKAGATADLFALADTWATRDGLWLSTVSKSERGERLLRGHLAGRPVKAVAARVDAGAGQAAFLVATLRNCLAQIVGNASELGAGASDAEIVHQLRVGLRRALTALSELDGFDCRVDPAWEAVLGRVFRALGAQRDVDTVIPAVLAEMKAAGVDCAWSPDTSTVFPSAASLVRAATFQRTLLAMLAFCHAPGAPAPREQGARKALKKALARRLHKLQARLARDAQKFGALSPARQHGVRKRLKRLRYLGEFAGPLFGAKSAARYLGGWGKAQDALGASNDHQVCLDALRHHAQADPGVRTAIAWLAAELDLRVARSARALRKAAKRSTFWD